MFSVRSFAMLAKLLLLLLTGVPAAPVQAQSLPGVSSQDDSSALLADTFGRVTPRGTIQGYLAAVGAGDFEKAANFLNLRSVSFGERQSRGIQLASDLKNLLDRDGLIYDSIEISNQADGKSGDELATNLDRIGTLAISSSKAPFLLERVTGENGILIWLVAAETLDQVPFLLMLSRESPIDRYLPEQLAGFKIATVPIGHWIALIIIAFASLAAGLAISWVFITVLRRFWPVDATSRRKGTFQSLLIPLGIVLASNFYRPAIVAFGVQVVARENTNWIALIVGWVAFAMLCMRIVDGLIGYVMDRMTRRSKKTSVAAISLARRALNIAIIAIAIIAVLDIVGVDVTAGLAALGIGGLALALGAQKTIENLVGSITMVADQPVRVGDFCKFGEVTGTVEDIGMRSTQVRTLERTIVTIPNGVFSGMQIENYSRRDYFKLQTVLTLRYETTPDQIRYLLVELRGLLYAHEKVRNDPARVRFVGLGKDALEIELFLYINAVDYDAYLEVCEDLLLRVMDIVKQSGTDFAFPSQTLYFAKDNALPADAAERVESEISAMKKKGELQIPRFDPKKIEEISNTIKFPQ